MLGDPGTLLFDEPMNGLDPEGIHWIRNLMRLLAAKGRAVLLSSHLIGEMALTADRLVVVGQGRLLAELSTEELAAQAPLSLEDVFLELTDTSLDYRANGVPRRSA
jgi:ABC-2 type transport system ATP-binding protein